MKPCAANREPAAAAVYHTRPYEPADLPRVLEIFDSNVPQYFTTAERPGFQNFLAALPGPYWVVESASHEMVACGGYAVVTAERRADLCWGMVARAYHKRGVGRFLTRARIDAATADPAVEFVHLNTSQHTRKFYEKLGFETLAVTPNGYGPGLDRCDLRLRVS